MSLMGTSSILDGCPWSMTLDNDIFRIDDVPINLTQFCYIIALFISSRNCKGVAQRKNITSLISLK